MSKHIDYEINRELGECYLFMGELEKAAEYYNKALDCATGAADPYLGLATIAAQQGDLQNAMVNYRLAAEADPSSDKALTGLGLGEMDLGNASAAFDYLTRALANNPTSIIALNGLVRSGHSCGRLDETIHCLSVAAGMSNDESIRYTLAACLAGVGRNTEAREQLEILMGANPAFPHAEDLYAQLAA